MQRRIADDNAHQAGLAREAALEQAYQARGSSGWRRR